MSSSLGAGVSGLRAHQDMLDVVGNNLANLNTTAFKSQRVRFSDLVYRTLKPATGGSENVGGTNPQQIGLGVAIASVDTNLAQGSLEATGGDLDLAIQGNGFFVANDGARDLYTRAGGFVVDKNSVLVDPATGYRIQRFGNVGEASATSPGFQASGDSSIKIPYGTGIPAKASSTVRFTGNLDAANTGPLTETMTSTAPFTAAGAPATAATVLNTLDGRTAPYQAGDRILITGTDSGGAAVNTSVPVTATSTWNDVLTVINTAYTQATASLDPTGNLVIRANNPGPSALRLTLADDPANAGSTNFLTHSMATTVTGKEGDKVNTAIQVFDPQGTPHTVALTFQKQGTNLWDLSASIDPQSGTMIQGTITGIRFNDDGSFQQLASGGAAASSLTFQINGQAAPQSVSMFVGSSNGFDGLTQFGGATSAAATGQDGYSAGYLTSVSVGQEGIITGVFTNGQTLAIAQVAMAAFTNPGGLNREGQNYFSLSSDSGSALTGAAQSGGRGTISSGSLEASNVDVAAEFTRLITAQRGFQVNARTITASNEVLQELANIIR